MFHKENPPAGARPGTLALPPDSPAPRIFVVEYDEERAERREVDGVDALRSLLAGPRKLWVDVQGLGDEAVLRELGELFCLHPIVLEDAVNVPQRAKSDVYDDVQLLIARVPLIGEDGSVSLPQVCIIVGEGWLLTFQERYFGFFDPVRERLTQGVGPRPIRTLGPDYLAYALIDTLVDLYYPIVERLSVELEELEEAIVEEPEPEDLARVHQIRRQLVLIRRIGWPQREMVSSLIRERTRFISEEVRVFMRDVDDHIRQIMELVDSCREMCSGLLDIYLSSVSHRTNEVMKVLTLMASIFIPLTFVAGLYGMNFEYMPELGSRWAYPMVLGIMVVMAIGMVWFFSRRGWLGSRRRRGR